MLTAFSGINAMFGEEVLILRHTRQAGWNEARKMGRGLDRDVYADDRLGGYEKANHEPIKLWATVSGRNSQRRKRESGEIRESTLRLKTTCPVYSTDNTRDQYADLAEVDGDRFKITDVNEDKLAGFFTATLIKVSDDFCVDTGA